MDVNVLREFVVLSEELNYSAASERLFVSRPSLTKHMQLLESELGVHLLDRNSHSVSLTPAGVMFSRRMSDILGQFDDVLKDIEDLSRNGVTMLRVGYLFETAGSFFPTACTSFMKNRDARLQIRAMEVQEIREGVLNGDLDLGLTTCVLDELPADCNYLEIESDAYGIIVPAESPLAAQDSFVLSDLEGLTLHGPSSHFLPLEARIFNRYLSKAQGKIAVRSSLSDIGSMLPALAMGADAVFTVGHVAEKMKPSYAFVPSADIGVAPSTALVWRKNKETEDVLGFANCVAQAFRDLNP